MKRETKIPVPERNLKRFSAGDEVRHLGLACRTNDCNFEVIDPERGLVRSLMTGDDITMDEGYFVHLKKVRFLPKTTNLRRARRGDVYRNILNAHEYQVLSSDEHTVKVIEKNSSQLRILSRIGSKIFYKLEKEESSHPVDETGQLLLFQI